MAKPPDLFKNQVKSIAFMRTRERILDASDPGTGKTRVEIEVFAARRRRGGGRALVLGPKSILRPAWQDDFKKFAPDIVTIVCPADKRERNFAQTADVYITNHDAAVWLSKQKPAFFAQFDTLIIDELTAFKHRTSQRSKAINKIKKYFKYRSGLTGTPNTNSLTDLWNQYNIIDDGKRLGPSFYQFRASVCMPEQNGPSPNMVKWVDKEGAELAVSSLVSDITIRHKLEDCIDIPENHMYSVSYYMSPSQTKAYKEMEGVALTMLDSGRVITAVNAAGVTTKLLQIASGASYSEAGTGNTVLQAKAFDAIGYVPIDSGRNELVADLVEQRQHCVVFFNWRHQRDQLIKEFEARGITYVVIDGTISDRHRKDAVDNFQKGLYRVLLAQPQSAAHGLTLTKGTTTIWVSPTYNLEHFVQGNRRIYRAGQKQKTETIVILAANTIEESVFQKLQAKDARQINLLDMLKELFHA